MSALVVQIDGCVCLAEALYRPLQLVGDDETGGANAPYALRKVLFLLALASALTIVQRLLLADSIQSYDQTFEKANKEAPALAPQSRVLIQEINEQRGKSIRAKSFFYCRHVRATRNWNALSAFLLDLVACSSVRARLDTTRGVLCKP